MLLTFLLPSTGLSINLALYLPRVYRKHRPWQLYLMLGLQIDRCACTRTELDRNGKHSICNSKVKYRKIMQDNAVNLTVGKVSKMLGNIVKVYIKH